MMQGAWQASGGAGDLPCKTLTSRFRGVCWNKKNKRWQAAINVGGKYVYLGSYQQEEDAARAFDEAALRMRGKEARTNFSIENYVCAETGEVNVQCCARVEAALMAAQEASALAEQTGGGRGRQRAISPQQHSPPSSACGSPANPPQLLGDGGVISKMERSSRLADSMSNNSTSTFGASDASDAFMGEVSQRLPAGSILERVLPCGQGMLGFVYRVGTSQQACAALLHGTHWDEGGTYSSVSEASRACAFAAKVLGTERLTPEQQVLGSLRSASLPSALRTLDSMQRRQQQQQQQHNQAVLNQQQLQQHPMLQTSSGVAANASSDSCAGTTGLQLIAPERALGAAPAMSGSPREDAAQLELGYRQGPAPGQGTVGKAPIADVLAAHAPLRVVTTTQCHPWGSHVAPETPPPAAFDTFGRDRALLVPPVTSLRQTNSMPPSAPLAMLGIQPQLASYGSGGHCIPDEDGCLARALGLRASACPIEPRLSAAPGLQCNMAALHSLPAHAAGPYAGSNLSAGIPAGSKRTLACGGDDLAALLPHKRLALA